MLVANPTLIIWSEPYLTARVLKALSLRARLEEHGFAGLNAVRAFQAAEGLVVDGNFGPITERALLGV